jgi:putative transposase
MSRLRRIELAGRYFFVTTNLLRNSPPLSPSERDMCLDHLDRARAKHKFALFAYVVMPGHVHFLLWAIESLLPRLMRDWKSASGFAIAKARSKRGAIWQERYFDFILRRAGDFGNKLEYIHANPVEAELIAKPEDWKWSSAAFYIKKSPVRIQPDIFTAPSNPNEPLWPAPWR